MCYLNATMRTLTLIVLLGVISSSMAHSRLDHYTVYKSFSNALQECAEYLDVSNCTLQRYVDDFYPDCEPVKKLIHCALHNLVAWNETGYRHHVIVSFFEPAPQDTCYENRTAECVRNVLPTCQDKLTQAYEVFQCYFRNYGNIRETKQWIPSTLAEFYEIMKVSIEVVNVPRCERIQYARGNIFGQPTFARAFLSGNIRAGYYSLQEGISLANFYTEFGNPEILTLQTAECVAAVERKYCDADHATRLSQMLEKCLYFVPSLGWLRDLMTLEVGTDLCGCEQNGNLNQ